MNWFERHLNWTVILATVVANLIGFLTFDLGVAIGCMVGLVLVYGWALDRKARSLWNILWTLVPYVGMIIFLCLENKSVEQIKTAEESLSIETVDEGITKLTNKRNREKLTRIAKQVEQQVGEAKGQTQEEDKRTTHFCPSCGNKVTDKMTYCPQCGLRLKY